MKLPIRRRRKAMLIDTRVTHPKMNPSNDDSMNSSYGRRLCKLVRVIAVVAVSATSSISPEVMAQVTVAVPNKGNVVVHSAIYFNKKAFQNIDPRTYDP